MNQLIKTINEEYNQRINCCQWVLNKNGIFPNTTHPSISLPLLQETILKLTYLFRVSFLDDIKCMLQTYVCKQQIEKAVLELEEKLYITSKITKEYGKVFCLTKNALFYFRYHPNFTNPQKKLTEVSIKDETIPSEEVLIKYKCLSSYISISFFQSNVQATILSFHNQDKEYKKLYGKKQYVQNIIYKQFLILSEQEKKEYLEALSINPSMIEKYCKLNIYSKTFVIIFTEAYLKHKSKDLEANTQFQTFRYNINSLFREKKASQSLYHFLKDFSNEAMSFSLSTVIPSLLKRINNILRDNDLIIRKKIFDSPSKEINNIEYKIYIHKLLLSLYSIKRRFLIRSNSKKTYTEEELKEATTNLKELDKYIDYLKKKVDLYAQDLTFLLYKGEKENGALDFFEKQIDFNVLKDNATYVELINQTFHVIIPSTNRSVLTATELFQKIERAYRLISFLFPTYKLHFTILSYGSERTATIHSNLKKVKTAFNEISDYRLLAFQLDSDLSVCDMEHHPTERYQFYQQFERVK